MQRDKKREKKHTDGERSKTALVCRRHGHLCRISEEINKETPGTNKWL